MEISPLQRQQIAEICRRYGVRKMSLFGSASDGSRAIEPQLRTLYQCAASE